MLTLSNKISLSRILFIPPLVFCITQVQHNNHYRYACLLIMIVIALSDMLDGYIARKRNEITVLGKYLDPFADKLVLMISCAILSSDRIWPEPRFPNWIPTIIISRDIFLMVGTVTIMIVTGRLNCQPIMLGKVSTFLQIIAVISVLIGNHIPLPVLVTIWWTTAVFTFASGFLYAYRGINSLFHREALL
ncbi:MAG: CDP-alcohol phosphatidyltransferase family protein [Candidatus Loosdrechtia sp.]|uniref:CDP-alcohol phosphatidyltransferase family protein n=1 Tax=Candidatus Loosdrechtia sp. TaxID=3101272 RepID=UPI003A5F2A63|nr:MAG: CDP-alcohol phosphatidyltransferase family protein [Candidatus Jettenia sp. AMX2]